jgi:hypothetical protein
VLGVGGVADDFVDAALGVALDGGVDGGGEHASHAELLKNRPITTPLTELSQFRSWCRP